MTVLENVALGGYLRSHSGVVKAMLRLDRDEEKRLFLEAETQLKRIGMGEQMHELAGNLALGPQRLMEIAVATLATDRALLLYGVPGTAKSWVSEHLAAAGFGGARPLPRDQADRIFVRAVGDDHRPHVHE